jgi:hypothetical protein
MDAICSSQRRLTAIGLYGVIITEPELFNCTRSSVSRPVAVAERSEE